MFHSITALIVLFVGLNTFAGTDVTEKYQGELADLKDYLHEIRHDIDDLKKVEPFNKLREEYRVLFVPGFYNILGNLGAGKTDQAELYFQEQIETLEELDVDSRMVSVDAVKGVNDKDGLDFLQTEIALTFEGKYSRTADKIRTNFGLGSKGKKSLWRRSGSKKKVVLVSHSRGGLDVLELLIQRPEVLEQLGGWVSIQTPYLGSPIADYVSQHKGLVSDENIAKVIELLKQFKQTEKAAKSAEEQAPVLKTFLEVFEHLTSTTRKDYMSKHKTKIEALERKLRILSVATNQPKKNSDKGEELLSGVLSRIPLFNKVDAPNSFLAPTRNWILDNQEAENDGVAILSSERALGDYIQVSGLDHFETVIALESRLPLAWLLPEFSASTFRTTGFLTALKLMVK